MNGEKEPRQGLSDQLVNEINEAGERVIPGDILGATKNIEHVLKLSDGLSQESKDRLLADKEALEELRTRVDLSGVSMPLFITLHSVYCGKTDKERDNYLNWARKELLRTEQEETEFSEPKIKETLSKFIELAESGEIK